MRKTLLIVAAAVIALLVAAVVYISQMDVNRFRPRIQAELQKQLGRPVSLGNMRMGLFPLSVRIDSLTIGEDPAFKTGRPFASAAELRVTVGLLSLLRGQLSIGSFVLRDPVIELVRSAFGKWNFSSLGAGAGSEGGEGSAGGAISVAELRVENGTLRLSDLAAAKPASVYERIGIRLEDFRPGSAFRLHASAQLPGIARDLVTLEARGEPAGPQGMRFAGKFGIREAPLRAVRALLGSGAASVDGTLSTAMDFDLQGSALKAQGWLEFANLKAGGTALDRPLRFDCKLSHNLDSGVLNVAEIKTAIGNAPLVVSGELDTRASRVDAALRTSGVSLKELLAVASAFGTSGVSGAGQLALDVRIRGPLDRAAELDYTGQGSLRDASLNVPALAKPLQVRSAALKLAGRSVRLENLSCSLGSSTLRGDMGVRNLVAPEADFNLDIDRLDFAELQQLTAPGKTSGKTGARSSTGLTAKGTVHVGSIAYNGVVLKNVRSECALSRGVLTLSPLTAELFGGKQSGSITVDMNSQPATVALKTNLESVDANQLLSATTSVKNVLYGLLAANGNAALQLSSGSDAARSLNGNLSIQLSKGKLGGVNLMNQLSNLGKFAGFTRKSEPFTDIVQLSGDIQIRNGLASTDNLLIKTEGASLSSAGAFNLVDQGLNLRLTAVLDRDTSQNVGGSRIGGYLSTALMNSNGELVIPALVTGTFANPRFAPDGARIAEMKLKNVVPSLANPRTAASGIMDILKGKSTPAESPQRKGVFGILDSIRKKSPEPAKKEP